MINKEVYLKLKEDDKNKTWHWSNEFKKWKYGKWIIDFQYSDEDVQDEITSEEDFEDSLFMDEGYTRYIFKEGDEKYDYVPNVCYVNFKKDIEKYKDLIIKCIDNYSND
jgi:hypothetical protein